MAKVYIDGMNGAWVSTDGTPFYFKGINELVKVEIPDEMAKEYGEIKSRYHEMNKKFHSMLVADRKNKPSCDQCGRSYTVGLCDDCKEMNTRK